MRKRSAVASALQAGTSRLVRTILPRRSVRLRLTAVYGALFLVSGTVLVTVTYLLQRGLTSSSVSVVSAGVRGAQLNVAAVAGGSVLFRSLPSGWAFRPAPVGQAVSTVLRLKAGGVVPALLANRMVPPGFTKLAPRTARQIAALQLTQHQADLHQLLVFSGLALLAMAILSLGLGWLVAGRALRPLLTITAAARRVSARSLHERLAFAGPDNELKQLADTFDGLLGRLEASFEAQRRFVANASHELRTPLARQRTLAEVALGDPSPTAESLRATIERLLAAGEQQERLIEALLTLARSDRGLERRERFDLADAVDPVVEARRVEARQRSLHIEVSLHGAPVFGEPVLFERLVSNLVDNALKHNVPDGRIEVSTWARSGHSHLQVLNTGPVVPEEILDRLLLPFQRFRPERTGHHEGVGLGLSIVQAIAQAHSATLTVRARPEGGLAVDVRLVSPTTGA